MSTGTTMEAPMFDLQDELSKLPDAPGVYIMHDKTDTIIYIGKARSLRKRVHQYFQPSHDEGLKKKQMVSHIAWFEYVITDSELEALILECNLIKEHCPKYNTMLRDDKTYPYIRVTVGEAYPRILFSRDIKKDRSKYFGPYTSAGAVKDTIELLNKIYHLRTCSRRLPEDTGKDRPCLNYHIHQCAAPCQGYITREDYKVQVDGALEFLNGNYAPVIKDLTARMTEASDAMEFEKAIELRELLGSVRRLPRSKKSPTATRKTAISSQSQAMTPTQSSPYFLCGAESSSDVTTSMCASAPRRKSRGFSRILSSSSTPALRSSRRKSCCRRTSRSGKSLRSG
jgi:excinuclease ABC subunit C